jgi:hypothetical protein
MATTLLVAKVPGDGIQETHRNWVEFEPAGMEKGFPAEKECKQKTGDRTRKTWEQQHMQEEVRVGVVSD